MTTIIDYSTLWHGVEVVRRYLLAHLILIFRVEHHCIAEFRLYKYHLPLNGDMISTNTSTSSLVGIQSNAPSILSHSKAGPLST